MTNAKTETYRELDYRELVAAAKEIALGLKNADLAIITFDGLPVINREEGGAHVQGWVWVRYPGNPDFEAGYALGYADQQAEKGA